MFLAGPTIIYYNTCAIEGRINGTRGLDIEEDKGIFGILESKVFEAPW